MDFKNKILQLLNRVYREDKYTNDLLEPIKVQLNTLEDFINAVSNNFFFNRLNENGCRWYEKLLKITVGQNQKITDRQSSIQAKWLSNTHNDIELLQRVCDAWKNGEVDVNFVGGKIQVKFIGEYGVPDDLEGLLKAVGEIKPAHLAYILIYKYLLIKDIHEVKTIAQMEQITLDEFAFGSEGIKNVN